MISPPHPPPFPPRYVCREIHTYSCDRVKVSRRFRTTVCFYKRTRLYSYRSVLISVDENRITYDSFAFVSFTDCTSILDFRMPVVVRIEKPLSRGDRWRSVDDSTVQSAFYYFAPQFLQLLWLNILKFENIRNSELKSEIIKRGRIGFLRYCRVIVRRVDEMCTV